MRSCELCSMKKRVASTPISSSSSSSVTNSPRRLDIAVRSEPSTRCTNWRIRTSSIVGIVAERREGGLESRDVAVVVGAERQQLSLPSSVELVRHVGDVGGEVGRLAARAHEHPVLVVAECRRAQPHRARRSGTRGRLPVDLFDRALQRARRALVEDPLAEEHVEADAVADERRLDPAQTGSRRRAQRRRRHRRVAAPGIIAARSAM